MERIASLVVAEWQSGDISNSDLKACPDPLSCPPPPASQCERTQHCCASEALSRQADVTAVTSDRHWAIISNITVI